MHLSDMIAGQKQFSERTFGPGHRTNGIVDHIKKELREIEENPLDLEEWIDVMILGADGAWRTGATPQEVEEMYLSKVRKNFERQWPDWRTADPDKAIEHIR